MKRYTIVFVGALTYFDVTSFFVKALMDCAGSRSALIVKSPSDHGVNLRVEGRCLRSNGACDLCDLCDLSYSRLEAWIRTVHSSTVSPYPAAPDVSSVVRFRESGVLSSFKPHRPRRVQDVEFL